VLSLTLEKLLIVFISCCFINGCIALGTDEQAEGVREYKMKKQALKNDELTIKIKENIKDVEKRK